jgi:hypothetical protein
MMPINNHFLDKLCLHDPAQLSADQMLDAVHHLGPLAVWWLHDDVQRQAAREFPAYQAMFGGARPSPAAGPGSCWMLVAQNRWPLLRPAILLPLRWLPNKDHSPRLPQNLRDLATEVCRQFDADGWGLHLNDDLNLGAVDLRGLEIGVDSAWAALAGSLDLAKDGLAPKTDIWATVAWDPHFGARPIDALDAKLQLAKDWGAEQIAVPAANYFDALKWHSDHGGARPIPINPVPEPKAPRILRPYVEQLGAAPDANADPNKLLAHYKRLSRRDADKFYLERLLGDVAPGCRAALFDRYADFRPTHVITVVSNTVANVIQGVVATGARRGLLVAVRANEPKDPVNQWINTVEAKLKPEVECQFARVSYDSRDIEIAELRPQLEAFMAGVDPARLAIDLTPGFKPLSFALNELAPAGCWLLYCCHEQLEPDQRPDPTSVCYEAWRAGASTN